MYWFLRVFPAKMIVSGKTWNGTKGTTTTDNRMNRNAIRPLCTQVILRD